MSQSTTIDRIKREISILDLAREAGCSLKKHGARDFVTHCLWHEDKNASLIFSPDKGLFHCPGCGKAGSVIDWIIFVKNLSVGGAIKELEKRLSPLAEPSNGNGRGTPNTGNLESAKCKTDITSPKTQRAIRLFLDYYNRRLKERKEPIDYLLKRGIIYGELIDEFLIGYCDGSAVEKLPADDQELIDTLCDIGLIHKTSSGYVEHFNDYIVFPIMDEHGMVTEIYGRSLSREREKHRYLPGPHQGFFNPKALIHNEVFVCESVIDALSIMTLGIRHVVAGYGVNGFTEEMIKAFEDKGVQKAYIAYDNDRNNSGDKAALRLADKLGKLGITSLRIKFPRSDDDGQVKVDANDFIRKTNNPAETFTGLINNADVLCDATIKDEDSSLLVESVSGEAKQSVKENWEKKENEYWFFFGDRTYIVRGLDKNQSDTAMKVFLRLRINNAFFNDTIDLYTSKDLQRFINLAAVKLTMDKGIVKTDLDKLIMTLEKIQTGNLNGKDKDKLDKKAFIINIKTQHEALGLVKEPLLLKIFAEDVLKCGVVGEPLVCASTFLATFSRILPNQLHVIIQAESSAGKSTILNLIYDMVPQECRKYFTDITPKSFYYTPEDDLMFKSFFVAEFEGMHLAIYPVKQMMSEGKLANTTTITDPKTGAHIGEMNEKEVKVQFIITSPKEGFDAEVENRCLILPLDESVAQTQRILAMQRLMHSPEGVKIRRERARLMELYQHVQRLIETLVVVNPYTQYLDFAVSSQKTRRDHEKYLTLMDCVTLFHQHQREIFTDASGQKCVRTHLIDVAIAHFMARRLFPVTLDELPPQTRSFFDKNEAYIVKLADEKHVDVLNVWIYRLDMRRVTKLSNSRTAEHADRLIAYEYMVCRRDENGIAYRLRFTPEENGHIRPGLQLADLSYLKKRATKKEREEYDAFIPYLKEIFKALDPTYEDGEY